MSDRRRNNGTHKQNKSMNEVILHRKDGREFKGTPMDCARILMSDGLKIEYQYGQPYGRWEAEDFCRAFNIDIMNLRHELGDKRFI